MRSAAPLHLHPACARIDRVHELVLLYHFGQACLDVWQGRVQRLAQVASCQDVRPRSSTTGPGRVL